MRELLSCGMNSSSVRMSGRGSAFVEIIDDDSGIQCCVECLGQPRGSGTLAAQGYGVFWTLLLASLPLDIIL